jgi:hypothetical protein
MISPCPSVYFRVMGSRIKIEAKCSRIQRRSISHSTAMFWPLVHDHFYMKSRVLGYVHIRKGPNRVGFLLVFFSLLVMPLSFLLGSNIFLWFLIIFITIFLLFLDYFFLCWSGF